MCFVYDSRGDRSALCQTVYPCLSLILSLFSECPWPMNSSVFTNHLQNEDRDKSTLAFMLHVVLFFLSL